MITGYVTAFAGTLDSFAQPEPVNRFGGWASLDEALFLRLIDGIKAL